jgi:hypothetical protein
VQINLPDPGPRGVIKTITRGALYKDIVEVAEGDVLHVLRELSRQEIVGQIEKGNPPISITVDKTKGKPIAQAMREVHAFFADREALIAAAIAARNALQFNGRRVTGRTLGAFAFYIQVGKSGALKQVGDIRSTVQNEKRVGALNIYIMAQVVHVRAWQWYGSQGQRLKRLTRDANYIRRSKATGIPVQKKVSHSVFEVAVDQVDARFASVDTWLEYINVSNLNAKGITPVDRIPAIGLCIKRKGRGGKK